MLASLAGPHAVADQPASPDLIGGPTVVMTRLGDTLASIARRHDIGAKALVAANPGVERDEFELNIIRIPAQHIVPSARGDLVINLAELRLYAWRTPGRPAVTMPIGIGRACPQVGPGVAVLEPDAQGWRLAGTALRIAAAASPDTVGTTAGRGCIEVYPEDAVRLALLARAGQRLVLIDAAVKVARIEDALLLEVHTDESGRRRASDYEVAQAVLAACENRSWSIDWQQVRDVLWAGTGVPTNVLRPVPPE